MALLSTQAVRIGALEDGEGLLIFADDALVAVLVRLSALHGAQAGRWFLEAAFGRLAPATPPAFDDVDSAKTWVGERLPH